MDEEIPNIMANRFCFGVAMRTALLLVLLVAVGCNPVNPLRAPNSSSNNQQTLVEARDGFVTKIVETGEDYGPPDKPDGKLFELIKYKSPVGDLAAYITPDPGDGQKHPAIVWITGGDNNTIGDVWTPQDRDNDQSASAFRKAGMIMMFPSQRGGNDNPGQREGFYGEVDDILAATDYLANLPYVDPDQIYLGGHSTGGTLAMLVGECSDRYKAIFAFGPVAGVVQYGGEYMYCDLNDQKELELRSPLFWLHCVKSPMFVFEGANQGNWDGSIEVMAKENPNPLIQFWKVPGHDHFSVITPITESLAPQIMEGEIDVSQDMVDGF